LFIAPDGELTRLPFEVLPTKNDGYLIDEYYISYLGAGRDVLRFGLPPGGQQNVALVVADPDFDLDLGQTNRPTPEFYTNRYSRDLDRTGFIRLPGTYLEGEQIAAMLKVKPLLQQNALETRLKAQQSPRILHIATHGFFLPNQTYPLRGGALGLGAMGGSGDSRFGRLSHGLENPLLRSGLALAGANTWLKGNPLPEEAEDGILTAEDVSGLDLLATDLVVLSACETGLGEVLVGEGVFGLRRAFILAGAKTLMISLWQVSDQQTQELMVDFYQRLLNGTPRAEALREAQLAMKQKYPEPRYWGAFNCQGDPGPLPGISHFTPAA
jgi:CHAT domain-containing protein